ncbi:DUF1707 and DUF4190 domain-containing protein [Streptomyces ziwulingensis]|uniref:DUF4190 domain-containing protein n=1 Tax=Streptomyces ziwulingensis TaxID=1045501 RepID=A0ABP9CV74_9ACTN
MSQSSWQSWQGEDEPPVNGGPWPVPGRHGDTPRPLDPRVRQGPQAHLPRPWPAHGAAPMLASHADRERAVDVLRAGYAEGRLEKAEFDQRVARAYAARAVGELAVLVGDLPQGPVPQSAPMAAVPHTFRPVPPPRTNGKAVGAAVCGLLCVPTLGLTGIPAVILGHTARAELQRTGEVGDGLAMTGLVLGWLSTGAWAIMITLMILLGLTTG